MERKEVLDIFISWIVLSGAFMVILSGVNFGNLNSSLGSLSPGLFFVSLFLVAISFLSHEFGHRQVAMHYGFRASFEMWPFGIMLAVVSSLMGFLFAAPGAVVIRPGRGVIENQKKLMDIGLKISVSGIAVNLAIGLALVGAYALTGGTHIMIGQADILMVAAGLNFFLAFFNLLPIPPLDGSKVFHYNKGVWVVAFVISIILAFTV